MFPNQFEYHRPDSLGAATALLAANLYSALRTLDAAAVDMIFARTFREESGLTTAIHDRLRRAAAGRIVHLDG